jgi:hypothetical protein
MELMISRAQNLTMICNVMFSVLAGGEVENDDTEQVQPDLPSSQTQSEPILTGEPVPGPSTRLDYIEAETPRGDALLETD